jgi:hypothetical protein
VPKKKITSHALRQRSFNEASEVFEATLLTLQPTSLPPDVNEDALSTYGQNENALLTYVQNAGFQAFEKPNHPDFQAILSLWSPAIPHNKTASPQYFLIDQEHTTIHHLALTHPVMTSTALLPHTGNPSSNRLPMLEKVAPIPCEISWALEPDLPYPTMVLKVLFRPSLPFGEKHYTFPCLLNEKGRSLSDPISTADPFVVQHYKCAIEWFHLLRSCSFHHTFSEEDIENLVTYQIMHNSLSQMMDVLNLYFSITQDFGVNQAIFVLLKEHHDQFYILDEPTYLFRQSSLEIKDKSTTLKKFGIQFTYILITQGIIHTSARKINSFHKISPDLTLYIQNGPFADLEICTFTGLLSLLHSLTLLPNIAKLARYTAETSDQSGRFLKDIYTKTTRILDFPRSEKETLTGDRGIQSSWIRDRIKNNACKLPDLEGILLTVDEQAASSLVLNIQHDLAEQLFNYLITYSAPVASPFSYYGSQTVIVTDLYTIFIRTNQLASHCIDLLIISPIRILVTGSMGKKSTDNPHSNSLEVNIGGHTFWAYPDYLSGDNCLLIQEALRTKLAIHILDNLTEDAKKHQIHPEVSQNFYPLLKNYYEEYFTLLTDLEPCTLQARRDFIEKHNTDANTKIEKAEKKLLEEEAAAADNRTKKKKRPPVKKEAPIEAISRPASPQICLVAETPKKTVLSLSQEEILQRQCDQLQGEINQITGGNKLPAIPSIEKKIDYLFDCLSSLQKLLTKKEQELANNKSLDIVRAVLIVENFYQRGLLLPYQMAIFFKNKTINNFNSLLSTLQILKTKLENIDSLYISLSKQQDSTLENDPRMKKLELLGANITLTMFATEKNINEVETRLQQKMFEVSQKKPGHQTRRQYHQNPIYVIIPMFRDLESCFDPKIAMQDFEKIKSSFLSCSANAYRNIKKKEPLSSPIYHPPFPFFSPQSTQNEIDQATQNFILDDEWPPLPVTVQI